MDVTLQVTGATVPAASAATPATPAGSKGGVPASAATTAANATTWTPQTPQTPQTTPTHPEVVHTTANHPWLSADHGWLIASFLHVGEPVRQADGSTAVVVSVRSVSGAANMWDLTVANVHTFTVGNGAFVVHNCDFETFKAKNKGVFTSDDEAKSTYNTVNKIENGNPYKWPNADFENDGETFENREGRLTPRDRTYYREYTVPGPGTAPGADPALDTRRIVTGRSGEIYYSPVHYRRFYRLWWG